MEKLTVDQILEKLPACFEAASKATQKWLNDHPNEWFPCGFAWVNILNGRSRLARVLKKNCGAYKRYDGTGFSLWNPSSNDTQAMYAKAEGCRAFINELHNQGLIEHFGEVGYGYRAD